MFPVNHVLEEILDSYLQASGLLAYPTGPLFPTTRGKSRQLGILAMTRIDAARMLRRRLEKAAVVGKGSGQETEIYVRLCVPGTHPTKINAPDSITARFTGKLVLGDPLLCFTGSAFLMRCLRTAAHEETALLSVCKFPFPELTPGTTDRGGAIPRRRALTLKTVRLCRLQALSVRVSQPERNFFLDIETRFFADVL